MSKQATRDTSIELAIRRELHRRGLRYYVHRRPLAGLRRTADIVFTRSKVAVFVDGCFWHGCPDHGSWPSRNGEFWRRKIETNRTRDADTDARLLDAGWQVIRVWEHEDPRIATDWVESAVRGRRSEPSCDTGPPAA